MGRGGDDVIPFRITLQLQCKTTTCGLWDAFLPLPCAAENAIHIIPCIYFTAITVMNYFITVIFFTR